jgi:hypothetical protein
MIELQILRRYFAVEVFHPDDKASQRARQYEDVFQYKNEKGEWIDVPIVIDLQSLYRAEEFCSKTNQVRRTKKTALPLLDT